MKTKQGGFTIIEIIVVILIFLIIGIVLFVQRNDIVKTNDDMRRKTAINSIYLDLTTVYHPQNGYYPLNLTADDLVAVDKDLLTDTYGNAFDDEYNEYHYEGIGCNELGKCKDFKLSVDLEREATYIRQTTDAK